MKAHLSSLFCLLVCSVGAEERWYDETLYDDWGQKVRVDRVIEAIKTECQELLIFENARLGRVLALDGVIQTTERDEYVYHEMMVHVPLLSHANPEKILILGGGDGGILREVVRHTTVNKITMVEIDASVIEVAKKFLPSLSNQAFEDLRLNLVIADAAHFVKECQEQFDVIICDSTDPIGPGQVLFTKEFYGDCKRLLRDKGIFVNQNGVPFMQGKELLETYTRRQPFYRDTGFYLAPVPTYVGGFMAFGWASDEENYRTVSKEFIIQRMKDLRGELKYYNPDIHLASFALPNFVKQQF